MKKMMKRLSALFIALFMVVTMLPTELKASTGNTYDLEDLAEAADTEEYEFVKPGDIITYDGEDAENVVDIEIEIYHNGSNVATVEHSLLSLEEGKVSYEIPSKYKLFAWDVNIASTWDKGWCVDEIDIDEDTICMAISTENIEVTSGYHEEFKELVDRFLEDEFTTPEEYSDFCVEFVVSIMAMPEIMRIYYDEYEDIIDNCQAKFYADSESKGYILDIIESILNDENVSKDELEDYVYNCYLLPLLVEITCDTEAEYYEEVREKGMLVEGKVLSCIEEFLASDLASIEAEIGTITEDTVIPEDKYAFVYGMVESIEKYANKMPVDGGTDPYNEFLFKIEDTNPALFNKYVTLRMCLTSQYADIYKLESLDNIMAYAYTRYGTYDVQGLFGEEYLATTFENQGFFTYLYVDGLSKYVEASKDGVDVFNTGLNVAVQLETVNDGKAIKVKYIITNKTQNDVIYGLASGADVKIGTDDDADIYSFEDGSGFKMISGEDANKVDGLAPQFNFYGRNRKGVVNVDGFWYGSYYDFDIGRWQLSDTETLFATTNRTSYTEDDAAAAWHWNNRTLGAGKTETLSVLIGISAEGEEESVGGDPIVPKKDDEKVAAIEDVVNDILDSIKEATNDSDIESKVKAAVEAAMDETLAGVEVEYAITKTPATTEAAGSIQGKITITSGSEESVIEVSYVIPKLPVVHEHVYTWVISKDATDTEKGEMKGSCSCGESQTKEIPATSGSDASGNVIVDSHEDNDLNAELLDNEEVKGKIELTQEDQDAILAGENLEIILKLEDTNVAVDTTEKEAINEKLEGKKLGTFLDINLIKKIGTTETKVKETTGMIKITIEVPEGLRNTDAAINRTYTIVRNHEGKIDFLNATYDKTTNKLSFETDKFSTYAVIYEDSAVEETPAVPEVPATGDTTNTVPFVVLLFVGLGALVMANKKGLMNN